jgi:hypothetical protein
MERRRHHADERVRLTAHPDGPTDHAGVAAEAALPERVTDEQFVGAINLGR